MLLYTDRPTSNGRGYLVSSNLGIYWFKNLKIWCVHPRFNILLDIILTEKLSCLGFYSLSMSLIMASTQPNPWSEWVGVGFATPLQYTTLMPNNKMKGRGQGQSSEWNHNTALLWHLTAWWDPLMFMYQGSLWAGSAHGLCATFLYITRVGFHELCR